MSRSINVKKLNCSTRDAKYFRARAIRRANKRVSIKAVSANA